METKAKILLVEDDANLSLVLKDYLEMLGYFTVLRKDGEEGLKAFKEENFNMCILDVMMPKKDGFAVLEAMRADERLKDVPVVLLTNLGEQEDVKRARRLGANEYLIKAHFLPSEVIGVVKKYIK